MAPKKHFDATNATQKINKLIVTVSEKSRKKIYFVQKCPFMGHVGLFFMITFFFTMNLFFGFQLFSYYHKRLILSYQNQNQYIIFQFLHLLRRRLQSRQGAAPGSKPRLAKQSVTPALRAVLINQEWYLGVKISKMFQKYLPENTLENNLQSNLA